MEDYPLQFNTSWDLDLDSLFSMENFSGFNFDLDEIKDIFNLTPIVSVQKNISDLGSFQKTS